MEVNELVEEIDRPQPIPESETSSILEEDLELPSLPIQERPLPIPDSLTSSIDENDNNYNNLVEDYKYIENVEEIKKYLVLKMNEDDNTETTIINDEEDFY